MTDLVHLVTALICAKPRTMCTLGELPCKSDRGAHKQGNQHSTVSGKGFKKVKYINKGILLVNGYRDNHQYYGPN